MRSAIFVPGLVAVWLGWLSGAGPVRLEAQPPETSGPAHRRPPWTTSRLIGSPEPPHPYLVERAFPRLQFNEPVELVTAPGTDRLFMLQLRGRVLSFAPEASANETNLVIDLRELHPDLTMDYGLTFHPQFQQNGYAYICYVLRDGTPDGSRVSRFTVDKTAPLRLDPKSEKVIITWLGGGHNGGDIHFGNDGYLYVSTGDGRGPYPPDAFNTGQDISDLLSSVLRLDVDHPEGGRAYRVPPDNPFVNLPGARPEVWCYGLRNPWRMNFDERSGDLWIGDVGWETWEMIYRAQKGANYGWSYIEGKLIVKLDAKLGPTPVVPPTAIHNHSEATCITGGRVYWGKCLPELTGAYIYGDYGSGKVWALRQHDGVVTWQQELAEGANGVVAFGQDTAHELYLVNLGGLLQRLVPNPAAHARSTFPHKLSETGLFADTAHHTLAPGVVPFAINAVQWNDSAVPEWFIALPESHTVTTTNGPWQYPKNTVLGKTLSLEVGLGNAPGRRRVETQLLHFDGGAWRPYSYRWNDQQTDAELVEKSGTEQSFSVPDPSAPGGRRTQVWRFHSRSECLRCHNPACRTLLAFTVPQLNRWATEAAAHETGARPAATDQLSLLAAQGVLDQEVRGPDVPRLADPYDATAPLADRARAYLHSNCSHCHREGAEAVVRLNMNYEVPLEKMALLEAKPTQGDFGMTGARLIAPGDPFRSVLFYRVCKLGRGRMPYLGSSVVDERGGALLHDWIRQLPPAADGTENAGPIWAQRQTEERLVTRLAAAAPLGQAELETIIGQALSSVSSALRLLWALDSNRLVPARRLAVVARAASHPNPLVRDLFERFVPEDQRVQTLGVEIKPERILGLQGSPDRGRDLFFRETGPQCYTCHRIGQQGRDFGPDLSHIGQKYSREQVLENILLPSKTIEPKFVGFLVETKDGSSHSGLVMQKTKTELVLKEVGGHVITIPAADISRLQQLQLSLMPEQLLQSLTAQQAADLIDFLSALK